VKQPRSGLRSCDSPAKLKHALLRPEGLPFNSHDREVVVKD